MGKVRVTKRGAGELFFSWWACTGNGSLGNKGLVEHLGNGRDNGKGALSVVGVSLLMRMGAMGKGMHSETPG